MKKTFSKNARQSVYITGSCSVYLSDDVGFCFRLKTVTT